MKLHTKDVFDLMDESEEIYINPRSKKKLINVEFNNVSNKLQHIETKQINRHEDHKVYGHKDFHRYK